MHIMLPVLVVQWHLGISDTQGTVKNCPEFWGGLFSQVYCNVYWICLGTEVTVLSYQVVPISQVVLKTGFTVWLFYSYCLLRGGYMSVIDATASFRIYFDTTTERQTSRQSEREREIFHNYISTAIITCTPEDIFIHAAIYTTLHTVSLAHLHLWKPAQHCK